MRNVALSMAAFGVFDTHAIMVRKISLIRIHEQ